MRHRYFKEYISVEERLDRIAQLLLKGIWLYNSMPKEQESPAVPIQHEKAEEKPTKLSERARNNIEPPRYMTTKEVVQLLKVSRTNLWRLRKQKKISYDCTGHSIRYLQK